VPYVADGVHVQWNTNLGFCSLIANPFGFKFHGLHLMPATLEFAVRFLCYRFQFLRCEKDLGVAVEHCFKVFLGNKLCTLNQEES